MCDQRKEDGFRICPVTGKPLKSRLKNRWVKWLFPITGLIATIWFLIRVLPKPSRAAYPCQRVAFPIASSFIAYVLGILGTAVALRRARKRLHQSRYVLAGICIFVGLTSAWLTISIDSRHAAAQFVPPDDPNSPMGVAKGIHPGRVAWVYDPDATDWNGSSNYYWDEDHTDANVVEQMMTSAVRWLAGEVTNPAAWDALFRYFNQNHDKGNVGYASGEKIAIKPNLVEHRRHADYDNYADLAPAMLVALLKQLVWDAGVPENCITVCESSRYISDKLFYRCYALFPDVIYAETNYYTEAGYDDIGTDPNRPPVEPTDVNMIFYSSVNIKNDNEPIPDDKLPQPFVDANYVINLAIMKPHGSAGVTLSAKNWYGCFCVKPGDYMPNNAHHSLSPKTLPEYEQYRVLVDLMGHEHLGGKTMLFILDGLWGFPRVGKSGSEPEKWHYTPFNNDYPSSVFMSQDHVAIDSVGLDFLRAEFADNMGGDGVTEGIDDYLHEAALANDPCSGTFYDPHRPIGDPNAIRLEILGVHEHWNNETDKQYTRNLGSGDGIELVSCASPLGGDVDVDCQVNYLDLKQMSVEWLADDNPDSNLDGTGNVDMKDFAIMANDWCGCNLSPQSACQ